MLIKPHLIRVKEQVYVNLNECVSVAVEPDVVRKLKVGEQTVEQRVAQISFYFGGDMGLTFTVGEPGAIGNIISKDDYLRISKIIKELEYNERVDGNAGTEKSAQ